MKHFKWSFLVGSYGEGGSAHRDPYVARLPLKLRRQEEVIGLRGIDEHFQLEALGGVSVWHRQLLAEIVDVEEARLVAAGVVNVDVVAVGVDQTAGIRHGRQQMETQLNRLHWAKYTLKNDHEIAYLLNVRVAKLWWESRQIQIQVR